VQMRGWALILRAKAPVLATCDLVPARFLARLAGTSLPEPDAFR
jgi:hypothetical protein